jgi:hypothetical protein
LAGILAKSTARKCLPIRGVADALLSSEWPSMCADVRNGDPSDFAPEIHVPREGHAIDRLVGFLGTRSELVRQAVATVIAFRCCPVRCQGSGQAMTPGD